MDAHANHSARKEDQEGLGLRDLARPIKHATGLLGEIYRAIESMVMEGNYVFDSLFLRFPQNNS
jgi:hypothetical protein